MALQDSDNFIVGRGNESYKITYQDLKDDLNYVPPPVGTIDKPTILAPADGAGSGVTRDIVTDAITAVEGGGIDVCETELIESVSSQSTSSLYIMTTTPSALSDVLANGTPYQEGAEIEFGEYLVRVNNEGPITGTVFAENPSVLGLYDAADSTTGCFNEFGVQIPTLAGSYNNAEWTNMELKTEAPNIAAFSYYTFFTDSSVAYQVYRFGTAGNTAGETDNLPALAAGSLTTLTFPSSQGFDCFEPGDVVQGGGYVWTASFGEGIPAGNASTPQTYDVEANATWQKGISSPISGNYHIYFKDVKNSEIDLSNAGFWIWGSDDGVNWNKLGNNPNQLYTSPNNYLMASGTFSGVQFSGEVKVISQDDSDPYTITVDGGEWSDGTSDPGTDQSQVWSALLTSDTGFISPETNAFDGDTSTHAASDTAGTLTFTPNLTVPANSTIEMWLGSGSGSNFEMTVTIDGVPSTVDGGSYQSVSYNNSTSINTITISRANSTNSAEIRAMKINGEVLVDAAGDTKLVKETPYDTKLTLAGSKDLADLNVGDVVRMGMDADVPYQPVSDSIVSVNDTPLFSVFAISEDDTSALYQGENNFTFIDTYNWTKVTQFTKNSGAIETTFFDFGSTATIVLNKGSADPNFYFSNDGVTYTYCGSVASPINGATSPGANLIQFTARYAAFFTGGDGTFVDVDLTDAGVTLTLSGDTDLAYFRTGDVVQGSADSATALIGTWAGSYDDAGSETTLTKGQSYAISGSSTYWFFEDTAPSNLVVQKSDGAANGLYIVGFNNSNEVGNAGTVLYTGDGPFEITFGTKPYVQVYAGGSGSSSFQLSSEGDVKIISIDDSVPSITVDGGEWDTSNQSQVWSENATGATSSDPATQAFDGDISTYAAGTGSTLEIPFTAPITVTSLRVYADGPQDTVQVILDGNPVNVPWSGSPSAEWWNVPISGSASFSKIQVISTSSALYAVEANGKLLVDAVNDSQVWSTAGTITNDLSASNQGIAQAFDGDLSTYWFPVDKTVSKYTFPSIQSGSKFEILLTTVFNTTGFSVNGESSSNVSGNMSAQWADVTDAVIASGKGGLEYIEISSDGGSYSQYIFATKIDGKTLIDKGVRDLGDTEVTCQSPLKAPTDWTVAGIEGNTLSLSHAAEDNSQVWVANDNQAGTDFYVTGPSIVDEPLLTADVELEASNFATTPVDSDTLKNIVWELNGVEQDAGTMNPYKPTLNTGTTYTVRVKHEGNTLEDSPWSDQTTFTTGATRNLYEYQRAQIQTLTTRVGGLEANDVTDDATDTALLTLLSNLAIRVQALEESN